MPEEKVLVSGEKPAEGNTKITYHGNENDPEHDVIFGVPMKKGQSVDLADHYPKDVALRYAEKLKGMSQFEVEGSPRAKPQAQRSFDQDTAMSAGRLAAGQRAAAQMKGQEPPEGYDAPLAAMLEKPAGQEAPQRQQQQEEEPATRRSNPPRGR